MVLNGKWSSYMCVVSYKWRWRSLTSAKVGLWYDQSLFQDLDGEVSSYMCATLHVVRYGHRPEAVEPDKC